MLNTNTTTGAYIMFNGLGVAVAYGMLALSLWLAPVDLSTKGYWGMSVLLLTLALVNLVKYRFDERANGDRIQKLEDAKNEKILEEYVVDKPVA